VIKRKLAGVYGPNLKCTKPGEGKEDGRNEHPVQLVRAKVDSTHSTTNEAASSLGE
jgi:hypothetical protein